METKQFGARLRELRKQASLSQRQLAKKIGVNFSYISKIENGVMPPPSDSMIQRLGQVFNVDSDELMTLAGRIPPDVNEMLLENREALQLIRSRWAQGIFRALNRARTSLQSLTGSLQILTKDIGLFFKDHRGFSRAAMAVFITLAIVGALWAAPAAKALDITVTNPSYGTLGDTYSFTIQIDINNADRLPITSVDLSIYNADSPSTYTVNCNDLPIPSGPQQTASRTYTGTDGTVSVSGTSGANWGGASGVSRYGYGYGYQSGSWGTPSFGTGYGYGYGYLDWGYGDYVGPASLTYTINWVSPSSWPEGTYNIRVLVYGNGISTAFTTPTLVSFTLETGRLPGGIAITRPPEPGATDVSDVVTSEGVFTEDVSIASEDGNVEIDIDEGTTALTKEGEPISEITVTEMEDPPDLPDNAIGLTYDLGPDGATFEPPISVTFTYDPADIAEGATPVVHMWDEAADPPQWVPVEGDYVVDPVTGTVTVEVSHFTAFTILAVVPPEVPVEEIAELEEAIEELENQVASLEDEAAAAQAELESAQARLASAQSDYDTATSDATADQARIASAQSDYDTAQSDVDAAQARVTSAQSDLAKAQERLADAQEQLAELEAKPAANWGVIGGIIAGVVVIGGLLVYFLWWRRRVAVA